MKVTLTGQVKNGAIKYDSPIISKILKDFEGKKVEVTICNQRKHRSNEQNRYYWGCVVPIIKNTLREAGNEFSTEQVHDLLKYKFLRTDLKVNEGTGEVLERVKSSTELSTSEFMDFIASVQRWSSDFFGVTIPDPNEQLQLV